MATTEPTTATTTEPTTATTTEPTTTTTTTTTQTQTQQRAEVQQLGVASSLVQSVDADALDAVLALQSSALASYRRTSASLETFNQAASAAYSAHAKTLERHTKTLKDMKKDLDSVYKRLRAVRAKLAKKRLDTGITVDPVDASPQTP